MESSNRKRALLGILFVLIGTLFLLDNMGIAIALPWYIFRWPMIFILLGVVNLLSGNFRPAFIFFGIGGLFYLDVFDVLEISDAWPVILIIIGLSFIFRGRKKPSTAGANNQHYFDEISILGGTEKTITSQRLQGGKITTFLGGSKIDLREANLQEGGATIELFCMFGGTEITVPPNWEVNMDATALLGAVKDERKNTQAETVGVLHIKGFVMFGGGELKS